MKTLLNIRNVKEAHNKAQGGNFKFNCWGATLYAISEVNRLKWIEESQMDNFLNSKTNIFRGKYLKKGDILTLWKNAKRKDLVHTAIYTGNSKFWHKIGSRNSEYNNRERIEDLYCEANFTEIRRLN